MIGNNCIKIKKFLFWKIKTVVHDYKMYRISKFMDSSETYHVGYKCSNCGCSYSDIFVEQDYLILNGIPVEELIKVTSKKFYYPNEK